MRIVATWYTRPSAPVHDRPYDRPKGGLRPTQTPIGTISTMTTYEGRRKAHPLTLVDRLLGLFRRHSELRETARIPVEADYRHRPYAPPPPPAPYRFPPGRAQ